MKYILLLAFILLFALACIKHKCDCDEDYCGNGFIYWGGSYAVDGIGWYYAEKREGNWSASQLKEEELPNEFKNFSDSTAVSICLRTTTERAPCFCASPSYFHKIVRIERR
jgi:hypothetical protein